MLPVNMFIRHFTISFMCQVATFTDSTVINAK